MSGASQGSTAIVVATELGSAPGGLAWAAAVAVGAARGVPDAEPLPVLLIELGDGAGRGPTMLASRAARNLERRLRAAGFGAASARGALCWLSLRNDGEECFRDALAAVHGAAALAIVFAPPEAARGILEDRELRPVGALARADLTSDRVLAALTVGELSARGQLARIEKRALGVLASRRALAGIDPGGPASLRARRIASAFAGRADRVRSTAMRRRPAGSFVSPAGQALPLALGLALALVLGALVLVALGASVAGAERGQSAADLAAISAVRSMRDDLPRLVAPATLPDGSPNPYRLDKAAYLERARTAASSAARRNGLDPRRVMITFPDAASPAPVTALVKVTASARPAIAPAAGDRIETVLRAEAEAIPPATAVAGGSVAPGQAAGGGYSGPLEYRQGKPMRPDVALAFDRMAAAAERSGLALQINSAFRSDAEQARLFAANPDPRWVAPPGTSLHRCATELDLGPRSADPWLATNAGRFGFLQRYSWEPWHYGYTRGPAPCSVAGNQTGAPDGHSSHGAELPAFVPTAYRDTLIAAAARWNVSSGLLAAQLEAESSFNPRAVSPAGALGIAQFMPATAATYGLRDPFDPAAAIDAQAHLMSDLLRQFGSPALALAAYNAGPGAVAACDCVPGYPETQAYVARILGLMDASGELALPAPLEVRLIR